MDQERGQSLAKGTLDPGTRRGAPFETGNLSEGLSHGTQRSNFESTAGAH